MSRARGDCTTYLQFLVSLVGTVCGKDSYSRSHNTISQTMSCMVLTRLMATNNYQRDEPCTIALERQVQTLAAAIERLTKQNHNLEE